MINKLLEEISPKINELEDHSLYGQINSIDNLKLFMERHVYAVFDFMSLTKALQANFSPIRTVWTPPENRALSRFINEIVLAEESDIMPDNTFMSHFEMYCNAMAEIKANSDLPLSFVEVSKAKGVTFSANHHEIPRSAKKFLDNTFSIIEEGKIHEIASSFCFGREKIIPTMFKALLEKINIQEKAAPTFYYYLKRHIEIDSDSHGPLALKMLSYLCKEDNHKWDEAKIAAIKSINARITFWDTVSNEIQLDNNRIATSTF